MIIWPKKKDGLSYLPAAAGDRIFLRHQGDYGSLTVLSGSLTHDL